jgi:hypothetical protein
MVGWPRFKPGDPVITKGGRRAGSPMGFPMGFPMGMEWDIAINHM